jgi:predicted metal-dependent HD superfamily phosphohydrolase
MKDMTELRERWETLWHLANGDPRAEQNTFGAVVGCYLRGDRHYHTLDHVLWGLRRIDEIAEHEPCRKTAAGLAMFFHDAVMSFNPGSADDEWRSAEMAVSVLRRARVDAVRIRLVRQLILETAHTAEPTTHEAAVLVDADLSMLGANPEHFDRYEEQVRKEWAHYPDTEYALGRAEVLVRFLEKPRIFTTGYAHAKWEQQAQKNLARSFRKLAGESA